eukprot:m.181117 g.181117  ORF g.181117 m.181117 type:complete len:270 (-) comp18030_c1_seq3:91-900(-)
MDGQGELARLVVLAKGARGAACRAVVEEALSSPSVFVFGELLDVVSVQQLGDGEDSGWWELLRVFAYGTYNTYKAAASQLPTLNSAQMHKLRMLTIVARAGKSKVLTYADLMGELDVRTLRELEDLIINAIYAGLIGGKMDQSNQRLEVSFAAGRDIQPGDLPAMAAVLSSWCQNSSGVLMDLAGKIASSDASRQAALASEDAVQAKVDELQKVLAVTEVDPVARAAAVAGAEAPMDTSGGATGARQQRKRQSNYGADPSHRARQLPRN